MYCIIPRRLAVLQQELAQIFRAVPEVQVVTDRRVGERRQGQDPVVEDRRKGIDRRKSASTAVLLVDNGFNGSKRPHVESMPLVAFMSSKWIWLAATIATLLSLAVGYLLWSNVSFIEAHRLGVVLVILGMIILGCSFQCVESIDGAVLRRMSINRRLWMGYRVRMVRWLFWIALILMALGSGLQW